MKECSNRKIELAIEAKDWKTVKKLLQQEEKNAECLNRYHHRRILEKKGSRNDGHHEVVASSNMNPEEALILKELKQDIQKAKETLSPIDRDIVEMVAEQELSFKKTARRITLLHKKISDVTVKAHYLKALKKLEALLSNHR